MTIPGRKPKPTKLKIIEGNPGKRPLNENEPIPQSIAPECPDWLSDDAKKEWKRLAPELERLGLLTVLDMAAFAGYCQSYAKLKKAEQFIKKHGTTYRLPKKDKKGKIISIYHAPYPEVAIANQCLKHIRAFAAEFGLTPSSRGRIYLPSEILDDEFEALLD
ncbi:hypothetical protein ES703_02494 [subsurface metagenome]